MSSSTSTTAMSQYEKTVHFNTAFGNSVFTVPQLNVYTDNPLMVERALNLILEEVQELRDAIASRDFKETIDALADIQVVVGGMACQFGINLDVAGDIVYKSNMSKLCATEQEARATVDWYLEHEKKYDSPYCELSPDGVNWVVRNRSTKKILKNMNYTAADFKTMF